MNKTKYAKILQSEYISYITDRISSLKDKVSCLYLTYTDADKINDKIDYLFKTRNLRPLATLHLSSEFRDIFSRLMTDDRFRYNSIVEIMMYIGHFDIPSLRFLYNEISCLKKSFKEVNVDDDCEKLYVVTEPICLEGIEFGRFKIFFPQTRNISHTEAKALEPNYPHGNEEYTHPHVQFDRVCMGDGVSASIYAAKQGRLTDYFDIVNSVLNTYGRSPFKPIEYWGPGIMCCNCGEFNSEEDSFRCNGDECENVACGDCGLFCCDFCNSQYCNDCGCVLYCGACGGNYHSDCAEKCSSCGDPTHCYTPCIECKSILCDDCIRTCNNCSEGCCRSCLSLCSVCERRAHCISKCNECGKVMCNSCDIMCESCDDVYCPACSKECSCNNLVCINCFYKCEKCNSNQCKLCGSRCSDCGKYHHDRCECDQLTFNIKETNVEEEQKSKAS